MHKSPGKNERENASQEQSKPLASWEYDIAQKLRSATKESLAKAGLPDKLIDFMHCLSRSMTSKLWYRVFSPYVRSPLGRANWLPWGCVISPSDSSVRSISVCVVACWKGQSFSLKNGLMQAFLFAFRLRFAEAYHALRTWGKFHLFFFDLYGRGWTQAWQKVVLQLRLKGYVWHYMGFSQESQLDLLKTHTRCGSGTTAMTWMIQACLTASCNASPGLRPETSEYRPRWNSALLWSLLKFLLCCDRYLTCLMVSHSNSFADDLRQACWLSWMKSYFQRRAPCGMLCQFPTRSPVHLSCPALL